MKRFLMVPLLACASACVAPPPPPPMTPNPPGSAYRAVGTEPFWDLTIDERQMIFTDRGNNVQVAQPTPRVIVGFAGEIYQTPRLNVNIVHAACNDGMSDRTYRDKVQIDVDGQRYNGCGGGAVAPATGLAGTSWHVVSINGRPTPPAGDYSLRFDQGRLAAKFGCNNLGGSYSEGGNLLTLGPVMATRMACPNMSFEGTGSVILGQPMTMSWSGGDRLTLSNAAGRIELNRSH